MTSAEVLSVAIKCVVFFFAAVTAVAYAVHLERRAVAHIQSRVGPNRVGFQGLLQPLADALKLVSKETVFPVAADKVLYLLAPLFASVPAFLAFSVIPVGPSLELFGREIPLHLSDVNVALLFLLAISSLNVYGVFLAGWSSNNKYSLYGGLRSSAQMISYELGLGLSVMGVLMMAGSFSLVDIVAAQEIYPFALLQPVGYLLFLTSALAELNRVPFDLPEAEAELVAGYHTEYSGMRFGLFFLGEYANMITASCLATLLFWGGWRGPGPESLGPLWFFLKVLVHLFFFIWTRGTFPRFRYDQLMAFGWKVLLPVGLLNVLVTGLLLIGEARALLGVGLALWAVILLLFGTFVAFPVLKSVMAGARVRWFAARANEGMEAGRGRPAPLRNPHGEEGRKT
jgi:NADH-quinone oxidoreductase subunit H